MSKSMKNEKKRQKEKKKCPPSLNIYIYIYIFFLFLEIIKKKKKYLLRGGANIQLALANRILFFKECFLNKMDPYLGPDLHTFN